MAAQEFDKTDHLQMQVRQFEDVDDAARKLIASIDYPPYGPWTSEVADEEEGTISSRELSESAEVELLKIALRETAP